MNPLGYGKRLRQCAVSACLLLKHEHRLDSHKHRRDSCSAAQDDEEHEEEDEGAPLAKGKGSSKAKAQRVAQVQCWLLLGIPFIPEFWTGASAPLSTWSAPRRTPLWPCSSVSASCVSSACLHGQITMQRRTGSRGASLSAEGPLCRQGPSAGILALF